MVMGKIIGIATLIAALILGILALVLPPMMHPDIVLLITFLEVFTLALVAGAAIKYLLNDCCK